jgi:hypothetical protein
MIRRFSRYKSLLTKELSWGATVDNMCVSSVRLEADLVTCHIRESSLCNAITTNDLQDGL